MKRIYLIGPLVLLLVFIAGYLQFRQTDARHQADRVAQTAAALQARQADEAAARKAALRDALATAALRQQERESKTAREKAERDARQQAVEARDRAFHEQEKIARQLERVKQELGAESVALDKLLAERKAADAEHAFLRTFLIQARANLGALQRVIAHLEAPRPSAPAR